MSDDKFVDRYRIESTRLPGWNYGDDGHYFVTICTKDRVEYFGDVLMDNAGEWSVALTDVGKIVRDELLQTPKIRPNVKLDEWVIMPNHVHAIIVIENERGATHGDVSHCRDALHASHKNHGTSTYGGVEGDACGDGEYRDARSASLQEGDVAYKNVFGPQRNNLASIVRGFKSASQSQIKKQFGLNTIWQTRYYDRIIRNERALNAVRHYIIENPKNWQRDRNNTANLWI